MSIRISSAKYALQRSAVYARTVSMIEDESPADLVNYVNRANSNPNADMSGSNLRNILGEALGRGILTQVDWDAMPLPVGPELPQFRFKRLGTQVGDTANYQGTPAATTSRSVSYSSDESAHRSTPPAKAHADTPDRHSDVVELLDAELIEPDPRLSSSDGFDKHQPPSKFQGTNDGNPLRKRPKNSHRDEDHDTPDADGEASCVTSLQDPPRFSKGAIPPSKIRGDQERYSYLRQIPKNYILKQAPYAGFPYVIAPQPSMFKVPVNVHKDGMTKYNMAIQLRHMIEAPRFTPNVCNKIESGAFLKYLPAEIARYFSLEKPKQTALTEELSTEPEGPGTSTKRPAGLLRLQDLKSSETLVDANGETIVVGDILEVHHFMREFPVKYFGRKGPYHGFPFLAVHNRTYMDTPPEKFEEGIGLYKLAVEKGFLKTSGPPTRESNQLMLDGAYIQYLPLWVLKHSLQDAEANKGTFRNRFSKMKAEIEHCLLRLSPRPSLMTVEQISELAKNHRWIQDLPQSYYLKKVPYEGFPFVLSPLHETFELFPIAHFQRGIDRYKQLVSWGVIHAADSLTPQTLKSIKEGKFLKHLPASLTRYVRNAHEYPGATAVTERSPHRQSSELESQSLSAKVHFGFPNELPKGQDLMSRNVIDAAPRHSLSPQSGRYLEQDRLSQGASDSSVTAEAEDSSSGISAHEARKRRFADVDIPRSVDDYVLGPVKGESESLEKTYLRLTSGSANKVSVRKPEVLTQSLSHVREKWQTTGDYHYTSDQLRSIRQDLLVQGIEDHLTVAVYEFNAVVALTSDDFGEFVKCQAALMELYSKDAQDWNQFDGSHIAYQIYYLIYIDSKQEISKLMLDIDLQPKYQTPKIKLALSILSAYFRGDTFQMFTLSQKADPDARLALRHMLEKERVKLMISLTNAIRAGLYVSYVQQILGFRTTNETREFLYTYTGAITGDEIDSRSANQDFRSGEAKLAMVNIKGQK